MKSMNIRLLCTTWMLILNELKGQFNPAFAPNNPAFAPINPFGTTPAPTVGSLTSSTPTQRPTIDSSEPHSTGYIDIAGLGIPLGVCFNGVYQGTLMSGKYECNNAKNAVLYHEWDGQQNCPNNPTNTVSFPQMSNLFDCDTDVNYWTSIYWGNETGSCVQDPDYWEQQPSVTNLCLPSVYFNGAPAGYSIRLHSCSGCTCNVAIYQDAKCQNLFSDGMVNDAVCNTNKHCQTPDPTICTKTPSSCLTSQPTSSPSQSINTNTPQPSNMPTTSSNITPAPSTSSVVTPAPTTSTITGGIGYIDIAGLGIPIGVCSNGVDAGSAISYKYTCNTAGDTVYINEYSAADCNGAATTVPMASTQMGMSAYLFSCDTDINYWSARVWGNDTGACAMDDDYWYDQVSVIDECFPAMYVNGQAFGYSTKIHDCTACSCSMTTYTDAECSNLFVEGVFGGAVCTNSVCWTADPEVCTESQICPLTTVDPTPAPTDSGGNVSPSPTRAGDTRQPTTTTTTTKSPTKQTITGGIGYINIAGLGIPVGVCSNGMYEGHAVSEKYTCNTAGDTIYINEYSAADCNGAVTTVQMASTQMGMSAYLFSCDTDINYWSGRHWSNETGPCVMDDDYWYDESIVINQCLPAMYVAGQAFGYSTKIHDCTACSCSMTIYTDAQCSSLLVEGVMGGAVCQQKICWTADPEVCLETQICPVPTPSPVPSPNPAHGPTHAPTTGAPTNSDGVADCPHVNLAGIGFPLDVCAGAQNYTTGNAESFMYKCNSAKDGIDYYSWSGSTKCNDTEANEHDMISLPIVSSFNCYGEACKYYMEKVYGNETGSCAQSEESWYDSYVVIDKCLGMLPYDNVTYLIPMYINLEFGYDCSLDEASFSTYVEDAWGQCSSDPILQINVKTQPCYNNIYHKIVSNNKCSAMEEENGPSTGAIIGIVVAVVVVLSVIVVGLAYYFLVYRQKQKFSGDTYAELAAPINTDE